MSKVKSKMRIGLKRILSVFLTLMLVQTAVPFTSFAESVANSATSESETLELDENTSADLQKKIDEANDDDAIQINSDVDMQQTIIVNKNIRLTGSGRLVRNHTDGPIIKIESPGKLTMEEIIIYGNLIVDNSSPAVEVSENSEFTMKSGKITENINTTNGGGIYNNQGTVIIIDGTIISNYGKNHGGGIYNNQGTVIINNGLITKNTTTNGGGIYNNQGTVTINGGEIKLNEAYSNYEYSYGDGGGIYNNLGSLIISGGTIIKNTASGNGGGIFNNYGTVTISSGEISANATSSGSENTYGHGGGIFNNLGSLTINGGTITKNTAFHNGGGIYNYYYGTVTINGGTISTNTAYNDGGGIYNTGTVTINGGIITENSVVGIYNNGTLTMSGGTITSNEKCGVYVCEKKQFKVRGSAKVIDNSVNKKNNVIFASEDGYIIIDGEFTGLIRVKQNSFNKTVIRPAEGYNITQSDLSCFESDSNNFHLNLIGNEIIYMESRTNWGKMVKNRGVTYYVDENGKASAEVGGKGKIWLNSKADGSGSWYCIDNSNGLFRTGSRFYIQVINDISKYYDKIGSEYRNKIEDGKLRIFLIGVTDPDGNEYTTLDSDLTCYVKIDPDWDKDKLRAIFINGDMTEKIDIDYVGTLENHLTGDKFAKLVIKHFSPYAIYQAKSNNTEITQIDTNANNINDSSLTNSFATGENFNYIYILGLWTALITALSGIVILKRKFNKYPHA